VSVMLINPFEVPHGQEEPYLQGWRSVASHFVQAPGFISTRLHESLDPRTRFRFVNVAEWESAQQFEAALNGAPIQQMRPQVVAYPALYRVISMGE
jgi:heme oxygenase (mycobilin-producing)